MFSARISSMVALATTLLISSAAAAQDVAADVSADTSATTTTSTTSTTTTSNNSVSASSSSSGDVRLTGQVRLDALNVLGDMGGLNRPGGGGSIAPVTPFMTLGVRLLDTRLFIGAGIGFGGTNVSAGNNSAGRAGFGIEPVVSYDLIVDTFGAFYAVGWINFVSIGESTTSVGNTDTDNNDDIFGIGFNAGVGIRGFLTEGLAIGTEIGWGCISANGTAADSFDHGIFGTLVFEASVGI